MSATTTPPTTPPNRSKDLLKRLESLAGRAQQGDAMAVVEIKRILAARPRVWKRFGDLAARTRDAWIKLATGNEPVTVECVRKNIEALREDLGRSSSEPLERLLVDRVVACHLQLQVADAEVITLTTAPSVHRGDAQKRQAAAQYAFDQAQKALTTYRQVTKARPSPVEMLRPQSEVTAGRAVGGRLAQSVGVG